MGIGIDYPKVDQKDLRVGDVIFPYPSDRETIGEEVLQAGDSDGDVETKYSYYDPGYYDFYLIKRAPVVLPTKPGSVVLVWGGRKEDGAVWMLTARGTWVNQNSIRRNRDQFEKLVASFNVDVIA